jgi:hypothetical protein
MEECQQRLSGYDIASVNRGLVSIADVCEGLEVDACEGASINRYLDRSNPDARAWLDIGHPAADPFPPPHMHGWLNDAETQAALGVPVNFSWVAPAVERAFLSTRDNLHGEFVAAIGDLLDRGVAVHLVYGDRDYACSWTGGEAAANKVPWRLQDEFVASGWDVIWAPPTGFAGVIKQVGKFSFSRVFDAGHMMPAYVPEVAYHIFTRAMYGYDISSGTIPIDDGFRVGFGEVNKDVPSTPPPLPKPRCYVLYPTSCSEEQWEKVKDGTAKVVDYWVVDDDDEDDETSAQDPMNEL